LITFLLIEKGLLSRPVLHLSYYFKRRRAKYYDRLQAVRDEGDREGWLGFFLRGVAEVSRQATEQAAAILRMCEEYRARITEKPGRAAANGHRVTEKLFDHPIVTVNIVRDWLNTTTPAANNLFAAWLTSDCSERLRAMPATDDYVSNRICACSKNPRRHGHDLPAAGCEAQQLDEALWKNLEKPGKIDTGGMDGGLS
jgi:hypothetical protein